MAKRNPLNSEELFQLLIDKLKDMQAIELIGEIRSTIAQGVAASDTENKSTIFRELTPEEMLTVAITYLVSAFEVPLMNTRCKEVIENNELIWATEKEKESWRLPSIAKNETKKLLRLFDVMKNLNNPYPELI